MEIQQKEQGDVSAWEDGGGVLIPRTKQYAMRSRSSNREYRILVSKPSEAPPPSGYPVIYLLDANALFATMAEAVRIQSRRSEKTGVFPAVIVGIGYPEEAPFPPARFYDFTMPIPADELPPRPDGTAWPELGGAEAFLTFIEEELKPKVEGCCPVDKSRQAIFGHSLGGLFVLQVLFTRPHAFQTYIAGSPSIHWNKPFLLEAEERFSTLVKQQAVGDIGIMIAVGELEKHHQSRMNENAKELSDRLSGLASCGVRTEYKEFEGEGHVSVLPGLISRAVRFVSRSS
ncbi:alpha/beta hydrolase [Brevibacillus borstelensis]|uniref:alpha/beta hydrolase n=1 Tax=Brevibacillus borstelensis TaxID=45462 RepID=UPI0030BAFA60